MSKDTLPDAETLTSLAKYSGDPWGPQNGYFAQAETSMDGLWTKLVYPFIKDCDFTHTIDFACGHGRNSQYLLPLSTTLLLLDIQPGNIEVCRKRFKDNANVEFGTNNGFDLQPAADQSATLIYCFDAMVHFDSDVVRSYLRDIKRVLKPEGRAFLHHSNYTGGHDWRKNPGSRNFMSAELFGHYCVKENLSIVRQQVIDWGARKQIDCLSLICNSEET